MKPTDSRAEFAAFADARGLSVCRCTPRRGFELMFSFFQLVQPKGCEGPNADMLLFQWGTNDWGSGRRFELSITRQFIEDDQQDDRAISQLSLTFKFEPTSEREVLGEGNHWCEGPTAVDVFSEVVMSTAAFLAVADQRAEAELRHSYV